MPNRYDKIYLGDSVYVQYDGFNYWIFTDNGMGPNTPVEGVALEPNVIIALNNYVEHCKRNQGK